MSRNRDRRSHVLPPSRKGRRHPIAHVIRREHVEFDPDTYADVLFTLTPAGRRALLEDRRDRDGFPRGQF